MIKVSRQVARRFLSFRSVVRHFSRNEGAGSRRLFAFTDAAVLSGGDCIFVHDFKLSWSGFVIRLLETDKKTHFVNVLDCDEDGCVEVCDYEDFKLMPGTADSNNTKCLAIFCSEDFTLTVHTCTLIEDPSCTYGHNYNKPFPDCCNQFCQSIVQLT